MPTNPLLALSHSHRAFAKHYVELMNGSKAAIAAGFSKKGAGVVANRLLKRPDVRAAILALTDDRDKAALVNRDRTMAELAAIAHADMGEFVDVTPYRDIGDDGKPVGPMRVSITPKRLDELSADNRKAIRELSYDPTSGRVVIKLHDKLAALAQIARMSGYNTDTKLHIHTADFGELERARDRARASTAQTIEHDASAAVDVTPGRQG